MRVGLHITGPGLALLLLCWSQPAACSDPMWGGHLSYALGGAVGKRSTGFRHGLDFAAMHSIFGTRRAAGLDSFSSNTGYLLGASGMVGFGKTPVYLAVDFGYGVSSLMGAYVGGGPVYRFAKNGVPPGYGIEGRLAFDLLFIDTGLHLMVLSGRGSNEAVLMLSFGAGRF